MFKLMTISKSFLNYNNSLKNINYRNLYWMNNSFGVYSLGICKNLSKDNKIENIEINKNKYVKFGESLFTIEINKSKKNVKAPFNCEIISRTKNFDYINNIDSKKLFITQIKPSNSEKELMYLHKNMSEFYVDSSSNDVIDMYIMFYK